MSAQMLDRSRTALVVVDVQEAFRKAVGEFDRVVQRSEILVRGARAMGVPVVVTEQYPRGLGATVPELSQALDGLERLPKTAFSAARADGFDLGGRDQALICGIETHVCVAQTALDLLERGAQVHIACDAVASRSDSDRETALRRLEQAGATLTSVESALFELLGEAGTPEFKTVQGLVK